MIFRDSSNFSTIFHEFSYFFSAFSILRCFFMIPRYKYWNHRKIIASSMWNGNSILDTALPSLSFFLREAIASSIKHIDALKNTKTLKNIWKNTKTQKNSGLRGSEILTHPGITRPHAWARKNARSRALGEDLRHHGRRARFRNTSLDAPGVAQSGFQNPAMDAL